LAQTDAEAEESKSGGQFDTSPFTMQRDWCKTSEFANPH
jgi:hypothetical protein